MPAPPTTPAAPAAAPATQTRRRAIGTWAAIGGAMLVVGIAMAAIAGIGQLPASGRLDADAAAPDGARAIVQILSERGVDVVVVHSREDAGRALSDRPATLAIGDTAPLEDATIAALAATADDVVLLEPRSRDLRLLLDGSTSGGAAAGPLEPACDLAEAERSGAVSTGIVYVPGSDAIVACYPSGDGYGLLVRHDGERRLAALDAATLLTNEHLAQDGNAALGLNLLGRHARLVWYLPGAAESEFAAPSLGDLTPSWVTPAMAMLTIAAIAAAVWRGRRFGPLVPENLPVTVRAGETTEGRARLYARAADPAHAADELRIAALRRLGRLLGLGPTADARTIADTAAAVLGADRHAVHGILLDEVPADDRALVDLVDRLHDLDDRLTRALRPMTPHPSDPSPPQEHSMSEPTDDDTALREAMNRVRVEVGKAVVGQDGAVTGLLIALLARGHVLLEGVPGVAKTLLVRAFSRAIGLDTTRVQFTPDLMPGDVTGSLVYDAGTGSFEFRAGPVFTNVLLADEINRTPPKTQAALLEAMEERQVSADGVSRPLPDPFLVAATQNPVEHEGTYSLPEAQLDRFLLKLVIDVPARADEVAVLRRHADGFTPRDLETAGLSPVVDAAAIHAAQRAAASVDVSDDVLGYVVDLARATRQSPSVQLGASPRAATALLATAKAWAWLGGYPAITPDHVQTMLVPTWRHRLRLRPEAEIEGVSADAILGSVVQQTRVPV